MFSQKRRAAKRGDRHNDLPVDQLWRTAELDALNGALRDEIIEVISKHVDIDRNLVEINLTQNQRENRLIANIPLLSAPSGGRKRRK